MPYKTDELKEIGCKVNVYDPYLPKYSTVGTLDMALKSECVILCTDHDEFTSIKPEQLKAVKVFVDGRNSIDRKMFDGLGIVYHGIGR